MNVDVRAEAGSASRHRFARQAAVVLGVVVAVLVLVYGFRYVHHHTFPKNFGVVEQGRIYRSGMSAPGPLRDVLREHGIRTILTLLSDEPSPEQLQQREIAREEGVRIVRISMPGNGRGTFEQLDEAAALLADPSSQPILVHCHAGANRTGVVVAAYRMRHAGWSLEQAFLEAADYDANPDLHEYLRAYAESRSVPSTQAGG